MTRQSQTAPSVLRADQAQRTPRRSTPLGFAVWDELDGLVVDGGADLELAAERDKCGRRGGEVQLTWRSMVDARARETSSATGKHAVTVLVERRRSVAGRLLERL